MDLNKFYEVISKIENNDTLSRRAPAGTTRMIYGMAKAINPKVYIDVGTFVGLTSLYVAKAMEESGGDGKVYTIELEQNWYNMAIQFAHEATLSHRIEFILGNSRDILPNLKVDKIDLVLLDGCKDLYKTDFETLEPKFHPGTVIFAHDTMLQKDLPFPSAEKFRHYIRAREEYDVLQLDYEYGTTIIVKK